MGGYGGMACSIYAFGGSAEGESTGLSSMAVNSASMGRVVALMTRSLASRNLSARLLIVTSVFCTVGRLRSNIFMSNV